VSDRLSHPRASKHVICEYVREVIHDEFKMFFKDKLLILQQSMVKKIRIVNLDNLHGDLNGHRGVHEWRDSE